MKETARRWIKLDGTQNCRDLGGIPVHQGVTKYGLLYRSDALHLLSDADQARLTDLSLTTILDFRIPFETNKAPNRLNAELAPLQKARPFLPNSAHDLFDKVNNGELSANGVREHMLEQYRILTLEHTAEYRQIIDDILNAEGKGVLFHCTSGKDRTGMISAIILAALGARDDEIVADYTLTNGRIKPIAYLNDANDPEVVKHIMAAAPEYMQTALSTMRSAFGSIENYLSKAIYISTAKKNNLRQLLVG